MDMYSNDLASRQKLNDRIGVSGKEEIKPPENKLKIVPFYLSKGKITIFNMQES